MLPGDVERVRVNLNARAGGMPLVVAFSMAPLAVVLQCTLSKEMHTDCSACRGKDKRCDDCLAKARRYMRRYQSGMKERYLARGAASVRSTLIEHFLRIGNGEMTGYTAAEIVRQLSTGTSAG